MSNNTQPPVSESASSMIDKSLDWFEELRDHAVAFVKAFKKARRKIQKVSKPLWTAMHEFLQANAQVSAVLGNDLEAIVPPTEEAQRAFWHDWLDEQLDEFYKQGVTENGNEE